MRSTACWSACAAVDRVAGATSVATGRVAVATDVAPAGVPCRRTALDTRGNINDVEFPAKDLAATRRFFEAASGGSFTDYGPDYTAFSATDAGLDGGGFRSGLASPTERGGALVLLYSERLEESRARVEAGCLNPHCGSDGSRDPVSREEPSRLPSLPQCACVCRGTPEPA